MYDLVLRSGRIVSPDGVVMGDLGVEGQTIAAIGQGLGPGRQEIDATGKLIFPGVVDAHVHFGQPAPGVIGAETFATGTRSAIHGGVTTVIDFTLPMPGQSPLEGFESRLTEIQGQALVDVALHVSVTGADEESLRQIPLLIERGAPSFKVYMAYGETGLMLGDAEFLRVAQAVGEAGGLLMVHAENGSAADFLAERLEIEGKTGAPYHAESRPDLVEAEAIHRAATLARLAGTAIYVPHLSSLRGLEVIRRFRDEGWLIYAETCPQYLLLDRSRYEKEQGHRFIASPPLRATADRQALTRALAEGEIEVLATDHCVFSLEQKDAGGGRFRSTPNGLGGVETLFPLMFSHLVALGDGGLTPRSNASLMQLARVLAENPARLFGLSSSKGSLRAGADADFILFDPNPVRRILAVDLHSAAGWTPYEGFEVRGLIQAVYLRGQRMVEGGQLYGKPGFGKFLPGRFASDETAEQAAAD